MFRLRSFHLASSMFVCLALPICASNVGATGDVKPHALMTVGRSTHVGALGALTSRSRALPGVAVAATFAWLKPAEALPDDCGDDCTCLEADMGRNSSMLFSLYDSLGEALGATIPFAPSSDSIQSGSSRR